MAYSEFKRSIILFSVTGRGCGKKLIEILDSHGIRIHLQFVGNGTASSEMMDILGLGSSDKDVLLSFGVYDEAEALSKELSSSLSERKLNGIVTVLAPSAMGRLMAAILSKFDNLQASSKGDGEAMKSTYKFNLVIIAVNEGYSEQVMQTAKRAGASGGTVIRSRMSGAEHIMQESGIQLKSEKEIITILASETVSDKILEEVNAEFGMRSEAGGIVCALPVEKAFKI